MAKYETTLHEPALMEYATIRSNDPFLFKQKRDKQIEKWAKEKLRMNQESLAINLIKKAEQEQKEYQNLLKHTLKVDDKIDWNELKNNSKFHKFTPYDPGSNEAFFSKVPKSNFFELILPFLKDKRLRLESEAQKSYEAYLENFKLDEKIRFDKYKEEKNDFEEKKNQFNDDIDNLKIGYETGKTEIIEKYISMVLENSEYPQSINLDHELKYNKNTLALTIKTLLPDMNNLNFISDVKYIKSKNEITKKNMPKKDSLVMYRSIINQIILRTIHEIFESEYIGHIQEITFEGFTKTLDPRTGKITAFSMLNLKAERKTFMEINLAKIDPEACIENMGSSIDKKNLDIIYKAAA